MKYELIYTHIYCMYFSMLAIELAKVGSVLDIYLYITNNDVIVYHVILMKEKNVPCVS